ncbi:MAG: GAF domain-containing protein [Chloroflexaceae bacterium]
MSTKFLPALINMQSLSSVKPSDLTGVLKHITQTAHEVFAADLSIMFAINPSTRHFLESPAVIGELSASSQATVEQEQLEYSTQQTLAQKVLIVENLTTEPDYQSPLKQQEGVQAFASIVLHTRQQNPLAVLHLLFRQPRQFSEDDHNYLHMFARSASFVLQKTRLVRRFHEVARIGQEINQNLETTEALFHYLQTHIGGIVDTSHFLMLAVYEPQTGKTTSFVAEGGHCHATSGQAVSQVMACQWVVDTKKPLVIEHLREEQDKVPAHIFSELTQNTRTFESLIFLPLLLRDIPLGVLSIQHIQPDVYDDEDLYILRLLGNHVSLALSNMRLYESVRRLNEAGQILTRQLTTETVLQEVVDRIHEATFADLVMLYECKPGEYSLELPPHVTGQLLDQTAFEVNDTSAVTIPSLILNQTGPIFAKDSVALYNDLYNELGGYVHAESERLQQREQIRSTAALPLRITDELIGVLFIHFRQIQRFDAPQKHLIEGLAHYAAIAIKNSRLFSAMVVRRGDELELLRTVDRTINNTLNLQEVLQTILDLAAQRISVDGASILLYNPRTQALDLHAPIGRHVELSQAWRSIPLNQQKGITRWVFEHKQPVRVANVQTDPAWRDIYVEVSKETRSELDVPLFDGDQVIGVINFESTRENAFSQEDQDFLVVLAGQAVLAVKNAQAYEREKRVAEERQALIEISQFLIAELDRSRVFALILDKALEITHSRVGTLMIYDPRQNDLWMAAERGVFPEQKDARHSLEEGIVGLVARERRLCNVADVTQLPWSDVYLAYIPHMRSELAVPILENNNLRGVINIESDEVNAFGDGDERLLTTLADLAVIALQNAEQYERAYKGHQRLKALHAVNLKIIAQLDDYDQVVQAILAHALHLTGAETVGLHWYKDGRVTQIDRARLDHQGHFIPVDQPPGPTAAIHQHKPGIIATVAETGKPYVTLSDAQDDPYYTGTLETHSEVAAPLLADGKLIAVVNLESSQPYAFDSQVGEVLELLAGQAVIAIQNAEAYARAERRYRRFSLLYQAGRELGEISDLSQIDQAYAIVSRITQEHGDIQVIIRRYDAASQELVLVHSANIQGYTPPERQPPDDGLNWQVARTRRKMVIPNVEPDSTAETTEPWMRSRVMIPIKSKEEHYYGNLGLSHRQANYFREGDLTLFEGLARQLAITIYRLEAVQAQREAEQQARELEFMSSIGQAAFELAHRLGNELGLVRSYINNVRQELDAQGIDRSLVDSDLDKVVRDVSNVLQLSRNLKTALTGDQRARPVMQEKIVIPVQNILTSVIQSDTLIPENVELQIDQISERLLVRVIPGQIEDILRNLLVNAVAALAGNGTIIIRTQSMDSYVKIQVEDNGPGITPERQSRIFDLFYSTRGSFGFGLWSARRNALVNGGDLTVQSEPDSGTIFILTLPRAEKHL